MTPAITTVDIVTAVTGMMAVKVVVVVTTVPILVVVTTVTAVMFVVIITTATDGKHVTYKLTYELELRCWTDLGIHEPGRPRC